MDLTPTPTIPPATPKTPDTDNIDVESLLYECQEGLDSVAEFLDQLQPPQLTLLTDATLKVRVQRVDHEIVERAFFQFEVGNRSFNECAMDAIEDLAEALHGEEMEHQRNLQAMADRIAELANKIETLRGSTPTANPPTPPTAPVCTHNVH